MANDRFLKMFFEEARELLQALEAGLVDLEAKQQDRAHLDRTFRAAHTLKGAAGMVGLKPIAQFTHDVETVLGHIRDGTLAVRPEVITTLLQARDHLDAAVQAAVGGETVEPSADLISRLAILAQGVAPEPVSGSQAEEPPPSMPAESAPVAPGPPPPAAVAGPLQAYRVHFAPGRDSFEKGITPLGMIDELRELGSVRVFVDLRQLPPLDGLEPRDCFLTWTLGLETTASRERLDEVFLFLEDPGQVTIEPVEGLDAVQPPVAVAPAPPVAVAPAPRPAPAPATVVPPALAPAPATVVPPATVAPPAAPVSAPPPAPKPAPSESRPKPAPAARLRVEAEQLDELLGLAGELAILTDSLQGLRELEGVAPWASTLEVLERLGRRLRDTTLELRMVEIEELFARFPRWSATRPIVPASRST